MEIASRRRGKQAKTVIFESEGKKRMRFVVEYGIYRSASWVCYLIIIALNFVCLAEVSSIEWEFINMTEQEEDLIYRMHRLVGDRWLVNH